MSMNQIPFQPGLSMPEFIQQYETETQCEAALVQARWPKGFCCPKYNHDDHYVLHSKKRLTFQCPACHQQTTLIAGTLFNLNKSVGSRFLAQTAGYQHTPVIARGRKPNELPKSTWLTLC